MLGFPYWLAVPQRDCGAWPSLACCSSAWSIRPILGQPAFSIVMLTIGIGYVARGLITMMPDIGTDTHALPVPYKDEIWKSAATMGIGAVLNVEHAGRSSPPPPCCARCCLRCFATASWASPCRPLHRTSWRPTTWASRCSGSTASPGALAAAVAAIAGLLLAPITFVHANMGFIGLKAFPAAVVGGFGSLPGAIVGGLVIGMVESLCRLLPARWLQGHRRLRRGAAHADGQAQRLVWRNCARKSDGKKASDAFHLQDRLRTKTSGWPSMAAIVFWYSACWWLAAAGALVPCRSTGWPS